MKIKELRDLLNGLPPEMDDQEIYPTMSSGCCGDYEELDGMDADVMLPDERPKDHPLHYKGTVRLSFNPVPGYKSCIQAGGTIKRDKEYWESNKRGHSKTNRLENGIRPFGDIMLDIEPLLFELHNSKEDYGHDMQHGEVLYAINGWQKIHVPGQIEPYTDGTNPIFYGHKDSQKPKRKTKKK